MSVGLAIISVKLYFSYLLSLVMKLSLFFIFEEFFSPSLSHLLLWQIQLRTALAVLKEQRLACQTQH